MTRTGIDRCQVEEGGVEAVFFEAVRTKLLHGEFDRLCWDAAVARHLIARMRPFGPIPSLNVRIRHPRGSQIKCN